MTCLWPYECATVRLQVIITFLFSSFYIVNFSENIYGTWQFLTSANFPNYIFAFTRHVRAVCLGTEHVSFWLPANFDFENQNFDSSELIFLNSVQSMNYISILQISRSKIHAQMHEINCFHNIGSEHYFNIFFGSFSVRENLLGLVPFLCFEEIKIQQVFLFNQLICHHHGQPWK